MIGYSIPVMVIESTSNVPENSIVEYATSFTMIALFIVCMMIITAYILKRKGVLVNDE